MPKVKWGISFFDDSALLLKVLIFVHWFENQSASVTPAI